MHLAIQVLIICFSLICDKLYSDKEKKQILTEAQVGNLETSATEVSIYNNKTIEVESPESNENRILQKYQPFKNTVQLKKTIEILKKLISKSITVLLQEAVSNNLNTTILNTIVTLIDNETNYINELYIKKHNFLNVFDKLKFYYYTHYIKENIDEIKQTYNSLIYNYYNKINGNKLAIDALLEKLHTLLNKLIEKIEFILELY